MKGHCFLSRPGWIRLVGLFFLIGCFNPEPSNETSVGILSADITCVTFVAVVSYVWPCVTLLSGHNHRHRLCQITVCLW